jgi:hypothetical protein
MKGMLDSSLSREQYELGKLKLYNGRNEDLKEKGVIFDSVYENINKQIKKYELRTDSLSEATKVLKKRVTAPLISRRLYKRTSPRVERIHQDVVINVAEEDTLFKTLEVTLVEADMSIEKGRLGGMLNNAAAQMEKEGAKIGEAGNTKDKALDAGNVDNSTAVKVDKRLAAYKRRIDSLSNEIKLAGQQLNSPVDTKKNFSMVRTKILLIDSVVNKKAASREFVLQMISEGMEKSHPNLYKLSAFFGPGGYVIPPEKHSLAVEFFGPVIDSLIIFSNKYESVFRISSFIVRGYADATKIRPGSGLYKKLSLSLDKKDPSSAELNTALSLLRAEEISRVLSMLLKEKASEFKSITKIAFEAIEEGYGEKLPASTITDYKTDDERRRIVVIFWDVLPGE